ncbi:MAG: ribose 5-phosphate isomerase B [Actinobacteria bacterium]|nr:MAG: ribose 5-phosphate isomerase B [Actinomycetota bacterium]
MRISIGSDHAGFELKKTIADWLKKSGYETEDKGTFSADSVDYPDFAALVAKGVAQDSSDKGIIVCSSGVGVTMAANKIKGVRAANCYNVEIAKLSRAHNNANVLTLGARFLDNKLALKITDAWLNTEFEGGRHQRRVDKISELEEENG